MSTNGPSDGFVAALLSWFVTLPKSVQAGGAALTLVTAGAVGSLTLAGFGGLPEKVEKNTQHIEEIEQQMTVDREMTARALCILELQVEAEEEGVGLTPLEVDRRCDP